MPGGAPSRLEAVEVTVQSARFSSLEKEDALKHKVAAIRKHLKAQKLQQRQRRGHASFWLSAEQEREHVAEKCGERSWQHTLVGMVQSQRAQVIIITLLVLDVLIIFAELFIDAEWPSCRIIERDGISCCPSPIGDHRLLASSGGSDHSHHSLCAAPLLDSLDHAIGCDAHKWEAVHSAHQALFACSVAILSAFELELLSLVAAIGVAFFRNPLYVLDLFVVTTSLSLELVFHYLGHATLSELVGLLVLGRVWRFLRIAHGLMVSMHEIGHHHMEELEIHIDEMEHELTTLVAYTSQLEKQAGVSGGHLASSP